MACSSHEFHSPNGHFLAVWSRTEEESLHVLLGNAGHVLYQYGQQKHLLGQLVVEFIERFLTNNEIIGYDLMEMLSGAIKQTPRTIPAYPKPSWMRLLARIPCSIASNVGELIVTERSSTPGGNCKRPRSGTQLHGSHSQDAHRDIARHH